MIFVIVVLAALILTIIFGGKLDNLLYCKFRYIWLVFLSAAIKIVGFSSLRLYLGITDDFIPLLRIASLVLVILFVAFNINLRGIPFIGAGLLCNALAIIANGGYMPVRADYIAQVAMGDELERLTQGLPAFNFIATNETTNLYVFSDVLLMPDWVPLSKVFSVGDILVTIGAVIFIVYYLKFRTENNLT